MVTFSIRSIRVTRNGHNCPRLHKLKGGLALTMSLFLGGCILPLDDATISSLMTGLAADNASACLSVNAGGGGGAVFPAPAIPVGGGYAGLIACRSNEPGSKIIIKPNGELEMWHGVYKIPVEEKELKGLRERIELYETWPKAWIVMPDIESPKEDM